MPELNAWQPEGDYAVPPQYEGGENRFPGNHEDDDGQASDFVYNNENPNLVGTIPVLVAATPKVGYGDAPKPTTRLGGTSVSLTPGGDPVMLLPSNPDRKWLTLRVNTQGGSFPGDVVIFSNEKNLCYSQNTGASVTSILPYNAVPHTGPVWAYYPSGQSAATSATVWAGECAN